MITTMVLFSLCVALLPALCMAGADFHPPRGVVVFLVDDLGYGDLGCQGNASARTPNIDSLAANGARFTQWISASSICTPSRAALLTGRLPIRSGMTSSDSNYRVCNSPALPGGLPESEYTLAEALGDRGWVTKLHLGIGAEGEFLPTRSGGFDAFYGMPVTNVQSCMPGKTIYKQNSLLEFYLLKMWQMRAMWYPAFYSSAAVVVTAAFLSGARRGSFSSAVSAGSVAAALVTSLLTLIFVAFYFYTARATLLNPRACLLYRNEDIVQQPVRLERLTQRNTLEAQRFLREHANVEGTGFFLLLSYIKVHTALFNEPEFGAVSYSANVAEMDWSVGEVLSTLRTLGVEDDTVVIFTSDNGPYLEKGSEGGIAGFVQHPETGEAQFLRGGKGQNWEGGIRVPGILRYPRRVAAGQVVRSAVSTMDIFPTVLELVDGPDAAADLSPSRPPIDGVSLTPLLRRPSEDSFTSWLLGNSAADGEAADAASGEPRVLIHYCGDIVHAVRRGEYKLHLHTAKYSASEEFEGDPQSCPDHAVCGCTGPDAVNTHEPPLLFHLGRDVGEREAIPPSTEEYEREAGAILEALTAHRSTTVDAPPSVLERFAPPWLFPCCDGFFVCECDRDDT